MVTHAASLAYVGRAPQSRRDGEAITATGGERAGRKLTETVPGIQFEHSRVVDGMPKFGYYLS